MINNSVKSYNPKLNYDSSPKTKTSFTSTIPEFYKDETSTRKEAVKQGLTYFVMFEAALALSLLINPKNATKDLLIKTLIPFVVGITTYYHTKTKPYVAIDLLKLSLDEKPSNIGDVPSYGDCCKTHGVIVNKTLEHIAKEVVNDIKTLPTTVNKWLHHSGKTKP